MADPQPQVSAGPRCANPDCEVASGGRCIEGFANTAECPQFGRIPLVPVDPAVDAYPTPRNGVGMPPATTLSVDEADGIIKESPSRVVAIAGPQAAGKTSLIAGLYDLFQVGQVGKVAFARSYSLHAFEQATHNSRAASRRTTPTTARTERGEIRFYHLDVVDTESRAVPSVLLGDRAGEEYLETRSNPLSARQFPELRRADVLTMLVDGQRLLDPGQRHNLRSEVRQTLQAFAEAGVLKPTQRLALVLTKLDLIREAPDGGKRTFHGFDTLVAGVRTDYGQHVGEVEPFQVAAQPTTGGAKRGENLDRLLAYWTADPLRFQSAPIAFEVPAAERYFARLRPAVKGAQ